jgi:hypothetical protein
MSATAGLQLPTGARGISGSGYNPYLHFHVSFGFNRNAPDYIVGVGYSFRFDGFW